MTVQFTCNACKKNISMTFSNWNQRGMQMGLALLANKLCYYCAERSVTAAKYSKPLSASQTPSEVK